MKYRLSFLLLIASTSVLAATTQSQSPTGPRIMDVGGNLKIVAPSSAKGNQTVKIPTGQIWAPQGSQTSVIPQSTVIPPGTPGLPQGGVVIPNPTPQPPTVQDAVQTEIQIPVTMQQLQAPQPMMQPAPNSQAMSVPTQSTPAQ